MNIIKRIFTTRQKDNRQRYLFVYNNKAKCFINLNSLPKGINSLEELSNKPIVYKITTKNNKIYIGSTCDFGERMDTHTKSARNIDNQLYNDIRTYGEFEVDIIGVYKTKAEANKQEKLILENLRQEIAKSILGNDRFLISKEEYYFNINKKLYNKKIG